MTNSSESEVMAERLKAIESAIKIIQEQTQGKSPLKMQAIGFHLKSLFQKILPGNNEKDFFSEPLELAIRTIKSNYLLLEKFQKGSENEQKLATLAVSAILDYNEKIEKMRSPSWSTKISSLLFKKLGIDCEPKKILLPIRLSSRFEEGENLEKNAGLALRTEGVALKIKNQEIVEVPLAQELDMFRMKGIMLLKNNEIAVKVLDLAKAPVKFTGLLDKQTVLLSQTLLPLPGEEIELSGEFLRKSGGSIRSVPQTFRYLRRSMQSGYPHSKQYAGWSFSDCLIPSCPLRPELIPKFHELHQRKNAVAIQLLPKGRLNNPAKAALQLKEEAFRKNKDLFLALHKQLAQGFLKICPETLRPQDGHLIIDSFFEMAKNESEPFKFIYEAYALFEKHFICNISQKLLEKRTFDKNIIDESKENGYLPLYNYLEALYEGALLELFKDEPHPSKNLPFVHFLGAIFQGAILFILIQEASETIGFCPPLLNEQERAVQAAAFKQLIDFLDECENPPQNIQEAENLLIKRLEEDILLFSEDFETNFMHISSLINELEEYYHTRHYQKV